MSEMFSILDALLVSATKFGLVAVELFVIVQVLKLVSAWKAATIASITEAGVCPGVACTIVDARLCAVLRAPSYL